jgi:hypothetical protein
MMAPSPVMSPLSPAPGAPPSPPPSHEVLDSRIAEVEALMASGRWDQIVSVLGSPTDAVYLPLVLQLVYGIARREASSDRVTTSDTDTLAIKAMARLLGVAEESPIAVTLAKRSLRGKRPWSAQKASKSFTAIFLVLGLGMGLLAGYLYTYFF